MATLSCQQCIENNINQFKSIANEIETHYQRKTIYIISTTFSNTK